MAGNRIVEIFEDSILIKRILNRLPSLFQLAEEESSRAGKIGMEVGSVREKIIIALLIYKFGIDNIDTNIPITEKEVDVRVFGDPISIKTITGRSLSGIKMIWTVDALSAKEFFSNFEPSCDIILIQINWNDIGHFYFIPIQAQKRCFGLLGKELYIKLPKEGTNPRGVELSKDAVTCLIKDNSTQAIEILWKKPHSVKFNLYQRWIELWEKD